MEKLLLFGSDDAEFQKINQIASRLKLHMERVDPADYALTLGEIASGSHKTAPCAKSADSASTSGNSPVSLSLKRHHIKLLPSNSAIRR